jgi:predicted O-linked N-acetylglucosamine transferase (SPINDLY family)
MSRTPSRLAAIEAMVDAGKLGAAKAALLSHLSRNARDVDAVMLMVYVSGQLGEFAQAAYFARRGVSLLPDEPRAYLNLSRALNDSGERKEALAVARQSVERFPDDPGVVNALVFALADQKRWFEALRTVRAAGLRWPDDPALLENHAGVALVCGLAREALERASRWAVVAPESLQAASMAYSTLNYIDATGPGDFLGPMREYQRRVQRAMGPPIAAWNVTPDPDRRLNVAILSPDFRHHATSFFALPYLTHHDRDRVRLACYSTSSTEDACTQAIRGLVDEFHALPGAGLIALSDRLRERGVDVIIDLAGHTLGNALPMLHTRPAPVQMTWIGFPASTGLVGVDYRITDTLADPPGEPWPWAERPLRLDPCFLCFRPAPGAPEPAPPPRLSRGHVTFGSISSMQKLSDACVRLWTRTVQAVPGSRLHYRSPALIDPELHELTRTRFVEAGMDPSRLELAGPLDGPAKVMAGYADFDISLDTVPYHGTTTTCESCWMGVPMVALRGPTSAARVNCSLLASVGLSDLVTDDEDGYVRTAAALAADGPRLDVLRGPGPAGLRAMMAASPLRDEVGLARRLDAAIRDAWTRWCASRRQDG